MKVEIKNRYTGKVIFTHEAENASNKTAVMAALNSGADLSGADLSGADLLPIRADFYDVLSSAPREAIAVLTALREGRVNGSVYKGDCACLVGTIENARHTTIEDLRPLKPNAARLAERFFLGISEGDTPETNPISAICEKWCEEWIVRMQQAFGQVKP